MKALVIDLKKWKSQPCRDEAEAARLRKREAFRKRLRQREEEALRDSGTLPRRGIVIPLVSPTRASGGAA